MERTPTGMKQKLEAFERLRLAFEARFHCGGDGSRSLCLLGLCMHRPLPECGEEHRAGRSC